jgi:predicted PurR-regulated permease PerM
MNNAVEPRLVGRSLNLSSLVIIVSLVFWGLVWGVLGMFLCVPFMVIINIALSKFDATRPIAILLSADGNVGPRQVGRVPVED